MKKIAKDAAARILPARVKSWIKDAAQVVRYTTPDPVRPSVPLTPRAQDWLKTMRRDGIVRIETPRTKALAEYLESSYFRVLEAKGMPPELGPAELGRDGLFALRKHQPDMDELRRPGLGSEDQYRVSMKDSEISKILLDPELLGLCYNYFRRQPYYRNQPIVDRMALDPKARPSEDLMPYHVDHARQISGMLLVSALDESTTHMEYLVGSHKRSLLKNGVYMTRPQCREWVRRAGPQGLRRLTGPAGTLYVFDASAVHRRNMIPGSVRKMYHWNITSGHHMQPFMESLDGWEELSRAQDFVREAFAGRRVAGSDAY